MTTMRILDRLLPLPRLLEADSIDLAAPPDQVWEKARHLDLATIPAVRALFTLRTLPGRFGASGASAPELRVDDLHSTREQPGFQILIDEAPREFAVGAVGKVWRLDIPFAHVADAAEFAAFAAPDYVKVAWAIRVDPLGDADARLCFELRVDATDDAAWTKFRAYFALIGPGSRFIRHSLLSALSRELGTPESQENARPLVGDELLPDAEAQLTHGVTIDAPAAAIWPWLVQMGCGRAGFYSYDLLDNGNVRSARELHLELQTIAVGQVLSAAPGSREGFEVLRIDPERALVLGGLFDTEGSKQLPFSAPRPAEYWQVTWAFALERLDDRQTRLHVRARAAFAPQRRLHLAWIRPVHTLMERAQLRHLKARVEGRLGNDDLRDVLSGMGGAAAMVLTMFTPFLREARSHWGLDAELARRAMPGDELVPNPRWGWTHGIEIDATPAQVWPWVAQIGADRGGFYSHQWLENVAGCDLRNAEAIHPEWAARAGDALVLHPKAPPLRIEAVEAPRFMLAYGAADDAARAAGKPWSSATWLFYLEPLEGNRSRFISRFRAAHSEDLATRLQMGSALTEPVGFVMDRRMLMGVKERAERTPVAQQIG